MSFTRIRNAFLDNLHSFTSPQVKILLTIARHTIGVNKNVVRLSWQDFREKTGSVEKTIADSIKTLTEKGIIKLEKNGKIHTYELLPASLLVFDPTITNLLAVENSFTPINHAFIDVLPLFTSPQVKILLTIARHTIGGNTTTAQISMPTFKEVAGIEPKVLMKNVEILVKDGLISVTKESNKLGNHYTIKSELLTGGREEKQGLFGGIQTFFG